MRICKTDLKNIIYILEKIQARVHTFYKRMNEDLYETEKIVINKLNFTKSKQVKRWRGVLVEKSKSG